LPCREQEHTHTRTDSHVKKVYTEQRVGGTQTRTLWGCLFIQSTTGDGRGGHGVFEEGLELNATMQEDMTNAR